MRFNIKSPHIVTSSEYVSRAEAVEQLNEQFFSPLFWAPCLKWLEMADLVLNSFFVCVCQGLTPSLSSAYSQLICFSRVYFTSRFELMSKGCKLDI